MVWPKKVKIVSKFSIQSYLLKNLYLVLIQYLEKSNWNDGTQDKI